MDTDTIWRTIDRQRIDLADLLDTLTPEQWQAPSLCAGWTVRDVAVHITQGHASRKDMALAAIRAGFRFNTMIHRVAVEDTSTPDEITAAMRTMIGSRRRPPMTADADPLMDVLVHGQDIAVPLGIAREMPDDAALTAAERLWSMGFPFNARKRFRGLRLRAVDAPFDVGDGEVVEGPLRNVVLLLAGRRAGIDGLATVADPDRLTTAVS